MVYRTKGEGLQDESGPKGEGLQDDLVKPLRRV